MTLNVGTVLNNRYRIVKLVGQGGFGAVYRAWDLSLLQPVALKENSGGGAEAQRQFEREAQLLAGLRHANLPRVIDHFVLPGQGQYLVMDFIEGKSLSDLLAECGGPLAEAEALPWIRQVAEALEYLHTRTPPIIHRDIKPDNVIVTQEGRAILVDFGISKVYEASKSTTIGARAVTPGYSPPEQYGRGKTDPRSDVYALGATLYTLLTGQIPPDGPDLASGADMLTPPRVVNPTVSAATSAAIVAAMAPHVSQRLGSAGGLATALASASSRSVAPRPRQPTRTPPVAPTVPAGGAVVGSSPAKRSVPLWGWIAGVVVLVALAAWAGMAFGEWNGGAGEPEATATLAAVVVTRATAKPTALAQATTTAQATTVPTNTATPRPSPTPQPTRTPTITPTWEPQAGDIRVVNRGGIEVEQVYVPAGSFMMGSEYGRESEQPVHEVTLDAFWLDRTEVTNAQFAVFVADTSYQTTSERQGGGHLWTMSGSVFIEGANWRHPRGPGSGLDERDGHPVVQVSWNDATTYCEWTGARLPTEAEWEYVARGPENVLFPWGDVFDGNRLNFCDRNCPLDYADQTVDDGYKYTAPVGAYLDGASWVGAMDMVGNVSEWVNDWYDSRYYYSSPRQNPTGPISSDLYDSKVSRGGGWNITGDGAPLSTFRGGYEPDHQLDTKGFRCATSLRDSVIANPTAEVAVTPALTGNIRVSARISLVDPAGCDQPGNFRDTATIPFQWRYDANLGPGEYMEVRIEPNPGTASQGKVTNSTNGLWRQAVSVANFDVGAGSYQWVVVHMAADSRTELATSDYGCFTIWSDN